MEEAARVAAARAAAAAKAEADAVMVATEGAMMRMWSSILPHIQ